MEQGLLREATLGCLAQSIGTVRALLVGESWDLERTVGFHPHPHFKFWS